MLQPTEIPKEAPKKSSEARWRRLKTQAHVRLALADIIRRTYDDDFPPERATACIAGLRVLQKSIADAFVEARVRELEAETRQ